MLLKMRERLVVEDHMVLLKRLSHISSQTRKFEALSARIQMAIQELYESLHGMRISNTPRRALRTQESFAVLENILVGQMAERASQVHVEMSHDLS
jgi:mannose/fructose/N-acetylgalactosamine-specific phosphotransferase system component IIB